MKSLILKIVRRLGYVLIRKGEWESIQSRLSDTANDTSVAQRLADSARLLTECRTQLANCIGERDLTSAKLGRAKIAVETLQRTKKDFQSQAEESRAQLARLDTSGRIAELELEKIRLKQRICDLETYLKETRGATLPYL